MQTTPPCPAPTCWWQTQASGLLLHLQLQLGIFDVLLFFFFFPQLCCLLRFQNSPKTCLWDSFLLGGSFTSFIPSPGWVTIPNSFVSLFLFIFCPTSFQKEWAAFLSAWCPPPAFRSCFVELSQQSNDLLINLWGRKWSPPYSSAILRLPLTSLVLV